MVESSLIIVVFLLVSIGIADIGQFMFQHESIVERVRAGLRYGVITYDPAAIRNVVLYGTSTPVSGATPSFNLTSSMVEVTRLDANAIEDRIRITVSNYPVDFYTPFIARRITGKPIVAIQPVELGNLP
jgi:hypothetical protein